MGKWVITAIIFVLVGVAYGLYMDYEAAKSVHICGIEPTGFATSGLSMTATVNIAVCNPSQFNLKINNIQYRVYVEGIEVGGGSLPSLFIPAGSSTRIPIRIDITSGKLIRLIVDLLRRGGVVNVEIWVSGSVPLTLYGVVELPLSITFTTRQSRSIDLGHLTRPQPVGKVVIRWEPSKIVLGQCARYIVSAPGHSFTVVIMQDRVLLPDREVARDSGINELVGRFCPKEPSSGVVRGYYIKVVLDTGEVVEQEQGYPPRLEVMVTG